MSDGDKVMVELSREDAQRLYDHTGTMPSVLGSWANNVRDALSTALMTQRLSLRVTRADVLDVNDPRWRASLEYTTDDDGIWLVFRDQRVNLDFDATLDDALAAALQLDLDARDV